MKYGNYYELTIQKIPNKGRGVFASEKIEADKLIILDPILVISEIEQL